MTDIVGPWRLVRAVARDGDGKELPAPYAVRVWAASYLAPMAARLS
jgi:hypothetical protein